VLWIILSCTALAGCSEQENVAQVSGRVTLDGQPLPGALVQFAPVKAGVPSNGLTDNDGKYVLTYTRGVAGAEIGEHLVLVSTFRQGDPDADPPVPMSPEKVPAKYAEGIKKEVKAGRNTIDIDLES
jgi:hypothetical protein